MKQFLPKRPSIYINSIICLMLIAMFSITQVGEFKSVFAVNSVEPYYCGSSKKPNICLMINVYWGNEYIEPMLDILSANNITTTFFVGGVWANKNSELLAKIVDSGHELGNHGYFHKDHKTLNQEQNKDEIYICHQTVKSLVGVEMNLFAPPSGSFSATTLNVANSLGYKTIMWTSDTIDWRDQNTDLIVQRAIKKMKNGNLILMHPTQCTLEALPKIIDYCLNNGFTPTTVSNCLD